MGVFKNILHNRYGRLIVCEHLGRNDKKYHIWRCVCDCGNTKIASTRNLSSGKSNSCGCLSNESRRESKNKIENREYALLKNQYFYLKRRHYKKSNSTPISFDIFKTLSYSTCYYCGSIPCRKIYDRTSDSKYKKLVSDNIIIVNGIDRIDSNTGYTPHNSVSCCKYCNYAKSTMTETEFKLWIIKVYNHFIKCETKENK